MFEILHQLTDNQVAILGCAGAVGASLLLLTISYHGNAANRPASLNVTQKRADQLAQERKTQRRAA